MCFTEIENKLIKLSRKGKKELTQEDINFLQKTKKSHFNNLKSWASDLLPDKQKSSQGIGEMFSQLGYGRCSIQIHIKTEKGLS